MHLQLLSALWGVDFDKVDLSDAARAGNNFMARGYVRGELWGLGVQGMGKKAQPFDLKI